MRWRITLRLLQVSNRMEGGGAEVVIENLGRYLDIEGVPNAKAFYQCAAGGRADTFRIHCPVNMLESFADRHSLAIGKRRGGRSPFRQPNRSPVKRASINLRRYIPMNDPVTRASFKRAVRGFRPDVVHLHNIMPSLAPLYLSAEMGFPSLVTLHTCWPACPLTNFVRRDGTICDSSDWSDCSRYCSAGCVDVASYMEKLQETLVERSNLLVATSDFLRQRMLDFGYPPEKVMTIHNGVEAPPDDVWVPEKPLVLFCGRMIAYKGPQVFIQAARIAKERGLEIEFTMVGAGRDADALERIAGEHVLVVPWLSRRELFRVMRGALCTVVPSLLSEALGLVVMESMACRTPVIASRVGGIPEMLWDGVHGYLVEPDAGGSMAEDIVDRIELLLESPSEREAMGNACLETYHSRFTDSIMAENYLEAYRQVTGTA